jgi:FkbM family methyltransferase
MHTRETSIEQTWQPVRSPFELARWKRAHAQSVEGDGPLHITTSGQPWHFAVAFPAERPSRDRAIPAIHLAVVRVDAVVEQGEIAVGILDREDQCLDETIRRSDEPGGPIDLLVDDLSVARRLLVRDTGNPQAPAQVLVRGIETFSLPPLTVGHELAPPTGLRLEPMAGWSRYYGDRFTSLAEKLRVSRYRLLERPVEMAWLDGLRVQLFPRNEMSRALYISGLYEPTAAVVVRKLLPPGGTFFDLGANMGLFTLLAASWVGPGGQVHAFEPSAREFARLTDHVRLNGFEPRVRAARVALADVEGTAQLHVAEDAHSGHNTLSEGFANGDVAHAGVEHVPMRTLDSYVREAGVRRLDVLKMDVEGSEGRVLAGARETLRSLRPRLVFEVNEGALRRQGWSSEALRQTLDEAGYALWEIDDASGDLRPLAADLQAGSQDVVAMHREGP